MNDHQKTQAYCQSTINVVEDCFNQINQPRVTKDLAWEWDEKHRVVLTHFARNFADGIAVALEEHFADLWTAKTINRAPTQLKSQLLQYGKLSKTQKIFTMPASEDTPALVAIWWPWGHGNTFSLRLGVLEHDYDITQSHQPGLFGQLKEKLFG